MQRTMEQHTIIKNNNKKKRFITGLNKWNNAYKNNSLLISILPKKLEDIII